MKKSKLTILILGILVIVLASFMVNAQPDAKGEKGPQHGAGGGDRMGQRGPGAGGGQEAGGFEMAQGIQFKILDKITDLTEEQKTKIETVKTNFETQRKAIIETLKTKRQEMSEIIKKDPETADEIKAKIKDLMSGMQKLAENRIDTIFEVKKILSKEQWAKVKDIAEGVRLGMENRREMRQNMMNDRQGNGHEAGQRKGQAAKEEPKDKAK